MGERDKGQDTVKHKKSIDALIKERDRLIQERRELAERAAQNPHEGAVTAEHLKRAKEDINTLRRMIGDMEESAENDQIDDLQKLRKAIDELEPLLTQTNMTVLDVAIHELDATIANLCRSL